MMQTLDRFIREIVASYERGKPTLNADRMLLSGKYKYRGGQVAPFDLHIMLSTQVAVIADIRAVAGSTGKIQLRRGRLQPLIDVLFTHRDRVTFLNVTNQDLHPWLTRQGFEPREGNSGAWDKGELRRAAA